MTDFILRFNKLPSNDTITKMKNVFENCTENDDTSISSGFECDEDMADNFLIVKSSEDGQPVAYAGIYELDDSAMINIFINPSFRRKGIFSGIKSKLKRRYPDLRLDFCALENHPAIIHMLQKGEIYLQEKQLLMSYSENTPPGSYDSIQLVKTDDLSILSDIHCQIFKEFTKQSSRIFIENMANLPGLDSFLFKTSNGICGMTFVQKESDSSYICSFGIIPEYRRKGIGYKCLSTLCHHIYDNGNKTIKVQVDADNLAAMALYRRFGFKEINSFTLFTFSD